MLTSKSIDARYRAFWNEQSRQTEQRLSNKVLVARAYQAVAGELQRGVPTGSSTDLLFALSEAEAFRREVLQQQASRGGRARKADPLQELIIEIVRRHPRISRNELLARLSDRAGPGQVIEEIVEGDIAFRGADGTSKRASLNGLKDRLTRAKKIVSSQAAKSR